MTTYQTNSKSLPVKGNLKLAYVLSWAITILMAAASIIGLVYRETIYPTDELLEMIMPNDVINLVVGVPLLLVSMWLAQRGMLVGLLLWPGALVYSFYNYLAYIFVVPLNLSYLLGLILVTLCAYTLIVLVSNIDAEAVQGQLTGKVPERLTGGIATAFGILFAGRVIVMVVGALINGTSIDSIELAVMVSDFVITPAMVIGGVMLWQRRPLGYASGLGLLFQASMLFIGLIAFLLIQPALTNAPFSLSDVLVVAVMGLVCFVPFGLFVRGVLRK
jgi:hypothetical protein